MNRAENEVTFKSLFIPLTAKKAIIFVFLIGLIVFFNSLFNPFQGDDSAQIVNNPLITSLSNIPSFFFKSMRHSGISTFKFLHVFYKPTLFTTYTLINIFLGNSSLYFHIIQLLFHTLNAVLIFLIFSRFFKKELSFLLSVIFLVHPINSEVVIYIADMQDVLFVFFGLSSFLLLLKWQKSLNSRIKICILSILLLFSFLSKETGLLFLAAFLLYGILFLRHSIKQLIIMLGSTLLIYLGLRYIASFSSIMDISSYPIGRGSIVIRLITIPKIIYYYLSKFVFPVHLAIGQGWLVKQADASNFFLPLFLDILFFALIIVAGLFIHRNINKFFKPYLFFAGWFCLGLIMHLQIIPLDATVADRWFYFPIIGLLGMIGLLTNVLYERIKLNSLIQKCALSLFCIIFLALSLLTIARNSQWHSRMELYSHDIKYAGESPMLYTNYGGLLMMDGKFNEAKPYLEKSVALDPKIGSNLNNLAVWCERNKNYVKAKSLYLMNIQLNPNMPRYIAVSYGGLARIALFQDNNPKEAKRLSELGLKSTPMDIQALEFLALSEYKLGNKEESLRLIRLLSKQSPDPAGKLYYYISQDKPFVLDTIFGATIVY
jgi:protein O-mannosyl-transferase